jgi:ectoine hydroxylase-related dioxygenase (phytanoyl-CoA dioxygenase family)
MQIEDYTPIRKSKIWSLLQTFYTKQGPSAWTEELVPQGSTSNCYTADVYAAIASRFILEASKNTKSKPPLIIELGGGSGRFAWQFLQRLTGYHFAQQDEIPEFNYLLTDVAEANLTNWRTKKRFNTFADSGVLQFGQLSVNDNPVISTKTGKITPEDLADRPVIIIANYLFDSLPTDFYRVKDNELYRELISLSTDDEKLDLESLSSFEKIIPTYSSEKISNSQTGNSALDSFVEEYCELEGNFVFPVPTQGFNFLSSFLERKAPMMLLAGDLAYVDPVEFPEETPIIFDSYMATYTNFHLFSELFDSKGGFTQSQRQTDPDFSASAFVYHGEEGTEHYCDFEETRSTAYIQLEEFNPYDAHEMSEIMQETLGEASIRQMFAWLRFSRFDPKIAQTCLPLLFEEIHRDDDGLDKDQLYEIYMECYSLFFPDGSPVTIDYGIAQLCLAINYNDEALKLLESSLEEFGRIPARLYVYALTLFRLERDDDAKEVLVEIIGLQGDYGPALRLFEEKYGENAAIEESPYSHLSVKYSDEKVLERALEIYHENGAVLIEDMFTQPLIQKLNTAFMERYKDFKNNELGDPNFVGNKRFTVPLSVQAPFSDTDLIANPVMMDLLAEVMGVPPIVNAFGSVVTFAGANSQHIHREHPLLFASNDANADLPTIAVTVLIPLVDLDESKGGTQLWEGTHKKVELDEPEGESTIVYTKAGSALIVDYYTFHGGMSCKSEGMRPMLFISYSQAWFRDTLAFESHVACGITDVGEQQIPEEHREMFRFATKVSS